LFSFRKVAFVLLLLAYFVPALRAQEQQPQQQQPERWQQYMKQALDLT